jgi:hypothetical protein
MGYMHGKGSLKQYLGDLAFKQVGCLYKVN